MRGKGNSREGQGEDGLVGKRQGKRWRGLSREGRAWYVPSDEGPGMVWK